MESKMTEYGIEVKAEVKSPDRYSPFYSQITRTFDQIEYLHFPNTFSYFFHIYDSRAFL